MTYSPERQGLSQIEVAKRVSLGQVNSQEFGSSRSLPVDFFGLSYLSAPQLLLTFGVAVLACVGIEIANFFSSENPRTK